VATKTAVKITPVLWATAVLVEMNSMAKAQGKRQRIPLTVRNVETLLRPITGEGSLNQDGGFLRDNNPWNIGTGCKATGAYGGTPKAPYGPDSRCGGGPVYLNTFATPEAGIKATAQYLFDTKAFAPLAQDAPSSLSLGGTWYKSDAKAASAVPVTAKAVAEAARELGSVASSSGPGNASNPNAPAGPVAPPKLLTQAQLVKKLKALIASGHPQRWTAQETYSFQQLTAAQRQAVTRELESYAQTYNNPDTSVGADIGRGFDKATTSLTSSFGFLSALGSAAFWKRIGIGAGGVVLIVAGTIVFLQSTKPVQAAEGAAIKVV
jgi:hypothetical protein